MAVRAVHLVTRLNVGGIARFLEQAGGAVDVLVRGRVERREREARWHGEQAVLPSMGRAVRPAQDARALADLVRLLRRLRPDVLHTHASKAGALGRIAAGLLRIPCVHTFHGHVLRGYFPAAPTTALLALERALGRRAKLTATGPATAAELERLLGRPVEVIAPGVALPPPSPGAREEWRRAWGSPALVALSVGRAAAVKDHPRFVHAARAAGYLPVVAGATWVAGALCLGHVDRMQDLYAAVDVVVCSSRMEGTPYALLEAAYCGLPTVAPPVGDISWILGGVGEVTDDLRAGLERLRDPALRRRRGEAAAKSVRQRFPAEGVAPRLRALYERWIAGGE